MQKSFEEDYKISTVVPNAKCFGMKTIKMQEQSFEKRNIIFSKGKKIKQYFNKFVAYQCMQN